MTKDEFKTKLNATISAKTARILESKSDDEKYLNYFDGQSLTQTVREIFITRTNQLPRLIEQGLLLCEAILAPTIREKKRLIRAAITLGLGTAGIAMIIIAIAAILHWGAGITAIVVAIFIGSPTGGPIALLTVGFAVMFIAGYFVLSGNPQIDSQRFLDALRAALDKAIDQIWEEYQEALSQDKF